jgi:hypothetical protein
MAAVDSVPEVVSAALDALARVGKRDDEQGGAAARALIALTAEPSRREAAINVLSTPAAAAHRRYRGWPAPRLHRCQVCERRSAGTDEAARCVARARVGARRSGEPGPLDGSR